MRTALAIVVLFGTIAAGCNRTPDNMLYVTNEHGGTLTMIDADRLEPIGTIPLGKRPRGIAVNGDRTRLYVALSGSPIAGPGVDEKTLPPPDKGADGIGEVDVSANKLLRIMRAGSARLRNRGSRRLGVAMLTPSGGALTVPGDWLADAGAVDARRMGGKARGRRTAQPFPGGARQGWYEGVQFENQNESEESREQGYRISQG